jgi:SSS family solute:Na+ symporter
MLAAAMSSLDSSLNSLSASTMRDFIHRDRPMSTDRVLLLSKVTTLVWGAIMTGFAFLVGNIADTVIEAVNKIGSAFYGPILAAFVIGVLSRRATAVGVVLGVLAGVGLNVVLWLFVPGVHFLWWNMLGFAATVFVASLWTLGGARPSPETIERYTVNRATMWKEERPWIPTYLVLVAAFAVILGVGLLLNHLAG